MNAPIFYHSTDSDAGIIQVTVGKSDLIRYLPVTRKQAAGVIAGLAAWLATDDQEDTP